MSLRVCGARDLQSARALVCFGHVDVAIFPGSEPGVANFTVSFTVLVQESNGIPEVVKRLPGYRFLRLLNYLGSPVEVFEVHRNQIELTEAFCSD